MIINGNKGHFLGLLWSCNISPIDQWLVLTITLSTNVFLIEKYRSIEIPQAFHIIKRKVEDWNIENQIGIVLVAHKPGPIWMLCYAIVEIQWPLVIIFINVLHSLTTIGTGNLNCNKWHTELDQCEKCIFLFENKIFLFLCYVVVGWWLCLEIFTWHPAERLE